MPNFKITNRSSLDQESLSGPEFANNLLFNKKLDSFNRHRNLILSGHWLSRGYQVFPSKESFIRSKHLTESDREKGVGVPILQVCSPLLSLCNPLTGSRFLTFERYDTPDSKRNFCNVTTQMVGGMFTVVKRYTMDFKPHPTDGSQDFQVIMFSRNRSSYADVKYKGTKLRWLGFGEKLHLIVLNDDASSLVDHDDIMKPSLDNKMSQLGNTYLEGFLNFLAGERYDPPDMSALSSAIAVFSSDRSSIVPNLGQRSYASVDTLEWRNSKICDVDRIDSVELDSLVIFVMGTILRKQEMEREQQERQQDRQMQSHMRQMQQQQQMFFNNRQIHNR